MTAEDLHRGIEVSYRETCDRPTHARVDPEGFREVVRLLQTVETAVAMSGGPITYCGVEFIMDASAPSFPVFYRRPRPMFSPPGLLPSGEG